MSFIGKLTIDNNILNTTRYRSPIFRVQKKNAIKKQNSVQNFDANVFSQTIDFGNYTIKNNLHKKVELKEKNNPINNNKINPMTNYNNFCFTTKKVFKNKTPIKRNNNKNKLLERKNNTLEIPLYNKNNNKEKRNNLTKIRKQSLPNMVKSNKNANKLKIESDYYCINCYNRKLMNININNNNKLKYPFKNINKSYDPNYYHKTLELKKLDEDYIYKKVLQNHQKQLRAFNLLKKEKDKNPKTIKEKLQYINENEDNPFIGFDLQDYLYYKNKKNNELLNKSMINNITTYELEMPRKAVKDYYKNVQFQIPVLEKQFGPSDIYKRKYIETLKKQINDKEKEKEELKKLRIKAEMEENKKYNEYINKLKNDEKSKKILKQKILYENNKNLEEFQKKRNEMKKNEKINGGEEQSKIFNRNQKDYKNFINQQRINEINSLQKWINENWRQKQKKNNKENNENKKWENYNKEFDKTFYDNTYAEKCANCNATYPINKFYEISEKKE